jgi:hypothetical protein
MRLGGYSMRKQSLIRMVIISGIFVFTIGCASMTDSAVRVSIESDEQTLDFIDTFDISKGQIYDRTLSWVTQIFVSSKDVIDLKDREAGIISINALLDVPVALTSYPCRYSLQIRVKDGKSKMTFIIGTMQTEWGGYPPKNSINKIHSEFDKIHKLYYDSILKQTSVDNF